MQEAVNNGFLFCLHVNWFKIGFLYHFMTLKIKKGKHNSLRVGCASWLSSQEDCGEEANDFSGRHLTPWLLGVIKGHTDSDQSGPVVYTLFFWLCWVFTAAHSLL